MATANLKLVTESNPPATKYVRTQDLIDDVVFCKAFRSHPWVEDLTAERPERRGYTTVVLYCPRCQSERREEIRNATGARVGGLRYKHTDLYKKIRPMKGDAWRREYVRRMNVRLSRA